MVANVKIRLPDFKYAYPGLFIPEALASSNVGFWLFNQAAGETEAESAERCSWNWAAGASNLPIDRRWLTGIPTFEATYARFRNDQPLVTNIGDWTTSGGCCFMIARSMDATIGAGSNDRAFVAGSYGGNTNNGMGFEFSNVANSQARAIDYDASGTVATNTIDMGTVSTDLQKWRLYYFQSGASLQARNLNPGDGTTPVPTATALTGNRKQGTQTFTIGGRISDSATVYTPAVTKDIAVVANFTAIPTDTERNTLAAQFANIAAAMGITLGA